MGVVEIKINKLHKWLMGESLRVERLTVERSIDGSSKTPLLNVIYQGIF